MKHEWRKSEKLIYLPKNKPEFLKIPKFKYFTIRGEGNPNSDSFTKFIGVLYSLSYAVKMSYKKGLQPEGYFDYTVYPLEGIWDLNEEAKKSTEYVLNKDDLVFQLMIRQPDFVNTEYAKQIIALTKEKKPHPLLDIVTFESITEGACVQMLHLGSFDNEPASFSIMEEYSNVNGMRRLSKIHKEIYLSDPRKVFTDKLKTVLRFQVGTID